MKKLADIDALEALIPHCHTVKEINAVIEQIGAVNQDIGIQMKLYKEGLLDNANNWRNKALQAQRYCNAVLAEAKKVRAKLETSAEAIELQHLRAFYIGVVFALGFEDADEQLDAIEELCEVHDHVLKPLVKPARNGMHVVA